MNKLNAVFLRHNLLDEAQHGYLPQRNTMTASLIHINIIEDAQEFGRPLHRTSFDKSKAFDSVSKNMMRIAWRRLGVPDNVADWLTDMDIGGHCSKHSL